MTAVESAPSFAPIPHKYAEDPLAEGGRISKHAKLQTPEDAKEVVFGARELAQKNATKDREVVELLRHLDKKKKGDSENTNHKLIMDAWLSQVTESLELKDADLIRLDLDVASAFGLDRNEKDLIKALVNSQLSGMEQKDFRKQQRSRRKYAQSFKKRMLIRGASTVAALTVAATGAGVFASRAAESGRQAVVTAPKFDSSRIIKKPTLVASSGALSPEQIQQINSETHTLNQDTEDAISPTNEPTIISEPTLAPTQLPTLSPTLESTQAPTLEPSQTPTKIPASPTLPPTPTVRPTEAPTATSAPERLPSAEEIVGNQNMAEFFLKDLVEVFKQQRREKYANDPAFAERIDQKEIEADTLNFVILGVDETSERWKEFSDNVRGRSDVTMEISINTHTLQRVITSWPRDTGSPEAFHALNNYRINSIPEAPVIKTVVPGIDPNVDPDALMRQTIETATGKPVDGIIQFNIDFTQGTNEHKDRFGNIRPSIPGFFQRVFPDGLPMYVQKQLIDNEYPVGYGTKRLVINPGLQSMGGRELTEYARTRHADDAFGRENRQREVGEAALVNLLPRIVGDALLGNTYTFNLMLDSLSEQQDAHNITGDVDFVEIAQTVRDSMNDILNKPNGGEIMAALVANSSDVLANLQNDPEHSTVSLGPSRANGLVVNAGIPGDAVLSVAGRDFRKERPTALGNYMNYWKPFRDALSGAEAAVAPPDGSDDGSSNN